MTKSYFQLFNETRARDAEKRKRLLECYSAQTRQVNSVMGVEQCRVELLKLVDVKIETVLNTMGMLLKLWKALVWAVTFSNLLERHFIDANS